MAVAGRCWGDIELPSLVSAGFVRLADEPCVHKTYMYHLVPSPPFEWIQAQGTFQSCVKNEIVSLALRHLVSEGEPYPEELARCVQIRDKLIDWMPPIGVATPWEVVAHKGSPAARHRYEQAFTQLDNLGVGSKDTWIQMFIKVEKWEEALLDVKAPRGIQFRSYRYCGRLAQYLLPIEKELWRYEEEGLCPFAKQMNSFRVASTLVQMAAEFDDPIYVLADHSKFDSCISAPWIEFEKGGYVRANPDPMLADLMDAQFNNIGTTKHGTRYWCKARKMSGEYNTSLGDTLVNYCILKDVFRHVKHRLLVNGDDSVIILERNDLDVVDLSGETWKRYGFKTTIEVVDHISKVEFCQSRPIMVREGTWRMVRTPARAISRSLVSVKRYQGKAWYSLLASLGYCELACGDGVPMLQSWAQALMRASLGAPVLASEISQRAKLERLTGPKPITSIARETFADAFGFTEAEQLEFEDWCERVTLPVLPAILPDDREFV